MPRGSSLYDRFQLSNSTAIPVYQGSAAPEMLKVADYKQGLYNQVQESALALDTNLDNMKGHPGDQAVVDETRNLYKQKLREATDAGNLEDLVPQMHQLGAQYVNDANAINAIQVGRQDYVKNQLESKELNLTGEQKEDFLGMSERAYTDPNNPNKLHRNERGQLVGGYSGVRVAKNIDLNKWVRENAKDIVATKLGREYYQGQNGEWLVKHGDRTETVKPELIRDVLYKAMLNDPEVQGYLDMEGRRAEYHGQNTSADQVPDKINGKTNMLKQQAIENAKALGTTFGEQYGKLAKPATIDQISRRAFDIGAETYGHRDVISTMDMSVNQLTQERNKEQKAVLGASGIVAETSGNPASDFKDMKDMMDKRASALETRRQAGEAIDRAKQTAKKWYNDLNGAGAYDRADNKEKILNDYFMAKQSPALKGNLDRQRKAYEESQAMMDKIDSTNKRIQGYILDKQFTTTLEDINKNAKADVLKAVDESAGDRWNKNISVTIDGVPRSMPREEFRKTIEGADVSQVGRTGAAVERGGVGSNSVSFQKDNHTFVIDADTSFGKVKDALRKHGDISSRVESAISAYGNDAMKNYSQTMILGTTTNEKVNKLMAGLVAGGNKKIYDLNNNDITADSEDLLKQINANQFKYQGTYAENQGGQNSLHRITVLDDDGKTMKTVRVGITTPTTTLAESFMNEAVDPTTGQIKDAQLYSVAKAMMPGSGYNLINKDKTSIIAEVKDKDDKMYVRAEKSSPGSPVIDVIDKDGNLVKKLSNQLELGTYLDEFRAKGSKYKVEFK